MNIPRPIPTAAPPWKFPTPERFTIGDHGLSAMAYHVPGQHILSLTLGIPLPISYEPRHVEGVARILADALTEGAGQLDTTAFTRAAERLGAVIRVMAGERSITCDVQVAARNIAPAVDLLRSCLQEPILAQKEIDLIVRQTIADLEAARAHPGQRAAEHFAALMFDPNDRLARPYPGTIETISAITREDIHAYYQALGPSGSAVAIAGDLCGIDVPEILTNAFGSWADGPARPQHVEPPGAYAPDWSRTVIVDRPGALQSEIRIGCPGPGRSVEGGWAPYPVLGYLMGGTTTSRLDAELREKRGYTYGIRAGFTPRDRGGIFQVNGAVRSEVTAAAIDCALDILNNAAHTFTAAETATGVDYLVKTAPGDYTIADNIADEAIAKFLAGSDTDEITRVLADMASMTPERLNDAWSRYIHGKWGIVIVGQADQFADTLRAAGHNITIV
ncbi:Peptidase M16 inactive domain [Dermatophilus congolensis]|uniref:Peptidase M16 inactive domain n=1 Tax=Dermatophilus congolensis TaxID=1863 RepID=A0A239VQ61_9MICO|nr:pitrilysin family protein [Dermatophilus congolensis]SNV24006.1 Peptidase M16 inactive domain [Dermatophilus congolensis]